MSQKVVKDVSEKNSSFILIKPQENRCMSDHGVYIYIPLRREGATREASMVCDYDELMNIKRFRYIVLKCYAMMVETT